MLNNAYAPNYNEIINQCFNIYWESGEDAVMDYLYDLASYDYKDITLVENWANSFYHENENDIINNEKAYELGYVIKQA